MEASYAIRRMDVADLTLVSRWRGLPHVARWWGEPSVEPETEKLSDPRIAMWIVEHEGRPFAFIQDYDVHAWTPHPFDYLPPGARGMDLYIGEADMLGQGHGSRIARQHVDDLFGRGVSAMGIDPNPDNAAARRAFEKAGFQFVSGPVKTPWGVAVLMDRRAPG